MEVGSSKISRPTEALTLKLGLRSCFKASLDESWVSWFWLVSHGVPVITLNFENIFYSYWENKYPDIFFSLQDTTSFACFSKSNRELGGEDVFSVELARLK
ncbi:MAG: hypothetical protein ABI045_05785 [Flavobacteriales bacterium]